MQSPHKIKTFGLCSASFVGSKKGCVQMWHRAKEGNSWSLNVLFHYYPMVNQVRMISDNHWPPLEEVIQWLKKNSRHSERERIIQLLLEEI